MSAESNRAKTECPQGHPYADKNLIRYKGKRYCRTCNLAVSRACHARTRRLKKLHEMDK